MHTIQQHILDDIRHLSRIREWRALAIAVPQSGFLSRYCYGTAAASH
jgi:hypothetical protein